MQMVSVFLGVTALILTEAALAETETKSAAPTLPVVDLSARVDCVTSYNVNKGGTQDCLKPSGLRATLNHTLSPFVRAFLALDPYAVRYNHRRNTPVHFGYEQTRDNFIMDYGIVWTPKPNLEVEIGDHGGTATLPSYSGLAGGATLASTGMEQTALGISYELGLFAGTHIGIFYGNGEGEWETNADPQQYVGFLGDIQIIEGVGVRLGVSNDNNAVSDFGQKGDICQGTRLADRTFTAQRLAAQLVLDGRLAAVKGLKAGIGVHQSTLTDLDKDVASYATLSQLDKCGRLSIDDFFIEDHSNATASVVRNQVVALSLSYRILDSYFLGIDFERRELSADGISPFQICRQFVDGICETDARDRYEGELGQSAFTGGIGVDLDPNFTFTVEYHSEEFDQSYVHFNYPGQDGGTTDRFEFLNLRLAYNWPE